MAAHDPAQNPRMGVKSNNANFFGHVGAAAGLNGVTDPQLISEEVTVLESLRDQLCKQIKVS
jgi:hypothetical protein